MVTAPGVPHSPAGISTFVWSQADALAGVGWLVRFGLVRNRTSIVALARDIRRLRREVDNVAPTVVHAQYGSMISLVAHAIRRDRPLVISFCGDDLLGTPQPGIHWRLRERLARALGLAVARRADAIITKSANLMNTLPPLLRDRATVLPNGVDLNRFRSLDREECRRGMGWTGEHFEVLFNASTDSNEAVKNRGLAEAAVAACQRQVPHARLRVLADLPSDTVPLALNAGDALLVTSLHEGSPNIVKEAMACDLPVVSVPCGDVPERLQGVEPGAVVDYDAAALGAALVSVHARRVRSNGRRRLLEQGLDAPSVARRLAAIYGAVVRAV